MLSRAKTAIVVTALALTLPLSQPASAKSVKDFVAMSASEQAEYLVSFLEKMTDDIGKKNPRLAREIKDYFVRTEKDRPISEGILKVNVELAVVQSLAKEGKADLSKIQVESIVVWVVKKKFPPPWTDETKN